MGWPLWRIDVVELKMRPVNARDWLWWTKPQPYLEIRQPEPMQAPCNRASTRGASMHWPSGSGSTNWWQE